MRKLSRWLPLLALTLAACSADHSLTAPPPTAREPGTSVSRADISGVAGEGMMRAIGRAINDSGVVVGYAATASLNPSGAAIWSPPDYVGEFLPRSPGMGYSDAIAVSNDGTVLGEECVTESSSCVPTIWRNGTITHLDALSSAKDICPCDGETVVGTSFVDGVAHATVAIQGFPLDAGVPDGFVSSTFTAIANGHIVGEATRADHSTAAFRWSPSGGWVMLPGGDHATVIDVDSHGDAIGWIPNEDANAFWPGDGSAPTLEPIGIFLAVGDDGLVVGYAPITQFGPPGGELWRLDSGWQGNAYEGSQFVAVNSRGSFLELVYGNAGIVTVVH
jgi:hypothetical protein